MSAVSRIFKPANRSLIRELVATDLKIRYQNSVLGYLWSLLRPIMLFGVLYVVFTKIFPVGKGIDHFPAYLLLGLVAWTFFVEATTSGLNAITGRGDMVRKVNVPKYAIVVSTTLSALVNFCFNMIFVIIIMIVSHVPLRGNILIAPLLLAELIALALALAFLLSALFVKYRDFSHIWDVVLQIMFYATPIIWLPNQNLNVSHKLIKILCLNPMAQIIQDLRSVMITPATVTTKQVYDSQLIGRVWPVAFIVGVGLLGGWYFRKSSRKFAEEL
jgi:ABC-2 type transport system permease protein